MRYSYMILGLILAVFLSCQPEQKVVKDANVAFYDSIKHHTGLSFQPELLETDSIQVLFYDNPDGDAKRYTRFYSWVTSSDSTFINKAKFSIDKHFERLEKIKECRSEGKMYLFKNGNPLQTIYFSNRGDTCNHVYFISNGWFYYMPMDSSSASFLKGLKEKAVKPSVESN